MHVVEELVEGIPWYAKYALIIGGALMSAFASTFPESVQTLGRDLGVGLALLGCVAVAWHWDNVWREKHGKPRLKLEPSYLIILGLVIAVIGGAWQLYRNTQPAELSAGEIAKITAPFQAQIDALKRQQSVALLFDHPPPEPPPPQPQPSVRRVYLRVDAEALTAALRQMHDVLNESIRDSTTMQGFFLGFENRRRNPMPGRQPPSIKDEIADIQEHLKQVQDFHMKVVTDLSAITRQVSSSYRDDLNPFIEASNPTATLTEPMAQYRIYLQLMEKLNDTDAASERWILQEYNKKIAEGIRQQYIARTTDMTQVDAKIREIQESQQR
jgi:hypothetical protein